MFRYVCMEKICHTPFGPLIIVAARKKLVYCNWLAPECERKLKKIKEAFPYEYCQEDYEIIEETQKQIAFYLRGELQSFELPLAPSGSEFQIKVWHALMDIPYGSVSTYSRISEAVGKPGAFRAVAAACGANPLAIIIPCHRVVAANHIGGYTGGIDKKISLLKIENPDNRGIPFPPSD